MGVAGGEGPGLEVERTLLLRDWVWGGERGDSKMTRRLGVWGTWWRRPAHFEGEAAASVSLGSRASRLARWAGWGRRVERALQPREG